MLHYNQVVIFKLAINELLEKKVHFFGIAAIKRTDMRLRKNFNKFYLRPGQKLRNTFFFIQVNVNRRHQGGQMYAGVTIMHLELLLWIACTTGKNAQN